MCRNGREATISSNSGRIVTGIPVTVHEVLPEVMQMTNTKRIANASKKLAVAALMFGAATAAHALTYSVTTGSFSSEAGAFTVDFGVSPINNFARLAGY